MEWRALSEQVVALVEQAGAEIMKVYDTPFVVDTKADDSPLTEADRRSHDVLARGLAALSPKLPVLSEEEAAEDYETRRGWKRYWLIDPLDGTKEFVSKNGEFTVNVALVEDGRPVLGVVGAPALRTLYVGIVPERFAEKRGEGEPRRLVGRPMKEGEVTVVASRSHGGERLEKFLEALGSSFGTVHRTPMGSSLKLCTLAEGRADLYPRLGPTSEWDIAAAQAVLEAAGGAVRTLDGNVLAYNTKASLLNPDFVAVADASFGWQARLPRA